MEPRGGARWGGAPVSMTTSRAAEVGGRVLQPGDPRGPAYRVAALQIAVLVAKGRDVDLHGRGGAAPLTAPPHRVGRPASRSPPGARAARGARPGPGSAARGRRARAMWGSAGPRCGACRAVRISWARRGGACGPESASAGVRGHAGRHPGRSSPAGSGGLRGATRDWEAAEEGKRRRFEMLPSLLGFSF